MSRPLTRDETRAEAVRFTAELKLKHAGIVGAVVYDAGDDWVAGIDMGNRVLRVLGRGATPDDAVDDALETLRRNNETDGE